jgi:hypothetical protein
MTKARAKMAIDEKNKSTLIGNHVRYVGLGGKFYCCPTCNRTFSRGFYYENNGKTGCTRNCLQNQS